MAGNTRTLGLAAIIAVLVSCCPSSNASGLSRERRQLFGLGGPNPFNPLNLLNNLVGGGNNGYPGNNFNNPYATNRPFAADNFNNPYGNGGGFNNQFPGGINNQYPGGINNQFPGGINSQFPSGTPAMPGGINSQFPAGTPSVPGGINSQFPAGTPSVPGGINSQFPGAGSLPPGNTNNQFGANRPGGIGEVSGQKPIPRPDRPGGPGGISNQPPTEIAFPGEGPEVSNPGGAAVTPGGINNQFTTIRPIESNRPFGGMAGQQVPPGAGPQGVGPQGVGPQGVGPQGAGPQGVGPQGAGQINPTRPALVDRSDALINPDRCGITNDDRIIGGNSTVVMELPWMARLGYRSRRGDLSYRCGGSLINNRYVLTAAHCVAGKDAPVQVRLGEYDSESESDCSIIGGTRVCAPPVVDVDVESIVQHPEYSSTPGSPNYLQNDVALLRLRYPVRFTEAVRPICLPEAGQQLQGRKATVAGWGKDNNRRSSGTRFLMKASVPVWQPQDCARAYADKGVTVVGSTQVCAGGTRGVDSCQGDSGGPLYRPGLVHEQPRLVQIGVVSFGLQSCAEEGVPGVYTRVEHFMPWIASHLRP